MQAVNKIPGANATLLSERIVPRKMSDVVADRQQVPSWRILPMTSPADSVPAELIGRNVVLDLASPYVCVGVLEGADHRYLILADADLHDLRDSKTTREHYLVECRRVGVRVNRQRVYVRHEEVVSLSALDAVVD